jgi:hypothetical protein
MPGQRRFVIDCVVADIVDEEDYFGGAGHWCDNGRAPLLYPTGRALRSSWTITICEMTSFPRR